MTASLVGQAGPDQRLGSRRRRDRRRAGSDRLSTSSQPQRSHPTRPPTSAVRRNDPTQPGHPPRRSEAGLTGVL